MPKAPGAWLPKARRLMPSLRSWRADLHREPELAGEEKATRAKIVGWLDELGIPARTYDGFYGVSAVIGGDRSGPTVALRADMDGLPVLEETGLTFRSQVPGRMHACGHDVHMACLLGAAALLKRSEERLAGPVTLLFQPAEEEGETGGAGPFIRRGCLDDPTVDFVVGQHVEPGLPAGVVHYRKGPLMAAADHFLIRIGGAGGHAAFPHQGADAILAASEVVAGLQALVSRRRDPLDPVVVSVGMIHGGTRHNVLPDEVRMAGTVRTFRPGTRDRMEQMVRERSRLIARSLGATARVEYRRGYPVTVNSPAATEVVARALARDLGDGSVLELERPVMGAEDCSRYLERVPGTFLFLGAAVPGRPAALHSARFAPPESILPVGAATLAAAAEGLQRRA
jgi:amidohydrolase